MDLLKFALILLCFFLVGCSPKTTKGCFGFDVDEKPWRGTRLDNRNYVKPYRQCVEISPPHKNIKE